MIFKWPLQSFLDILHWFWKLSKKCNLAITVLT